MNNNIGHQLFIRFGLLSQPSPNAINQWIKITEQLIAQGYSEQQAADKAAFQVFPDFNSRVYLSQADTIEALLAALRKKTK